MRKVRIFLATLIAILLSYSNEAWATTEGTYVPDSGSGIEKIILIVIGIAAVALVLFIGYKMDKKEETKKETVRTAPPAQTGAFVVQLLAVQSRDAAEKEAAKYRSKYPDVFIKQVSIDGKTWYRVRLGISATKEQAQQKANKVASEFKIKPIVTKNN